MNKANKKEDYHSPFADSPTTNETTGDNINLFKELLPNPGCSLFIRVNGDDFKNVGLIDGDKLIIDTSIKPTPDDLIVYKYNGQYSVNYIDLKKDGIYINQEGAAPIRINQADKTAFIGVVVYMILNQRKQKRLVKI